MATVKNRSLKLLASVENVLGVDLRDESLKDYDFERKRDELENAYSTFRGDWTLPELESGESRPLLLNLHDQEFVSIAEQGSYDPVTYFYGGPMSLYRAVFKEGYSATGGYQSISSKLDLVIQRIKLHCLYSDSVALELPFSSYLVPEGLVAICTKFEPLVKSGVVHFTPQLAKTTVHDGIVRHEDGVELSDIANALGVTLHRFPSLNASNDPFGSLTGAYANAADNLYLDLESEMRGERMVAVVKQVLAAFEATREAPEQLDPYFGPRDVEFIRRLLDAPPEIVNRLPDERPTLQRYGDSWLAFNHLLDLPVPVGNIKLTDIVRLREHGQFETLRAGIRAGLDEITRSSFESFLNPEAVQMSVIHDHLKDSHSQAQAEWRNSRWIRQRMPDTLDLTLAVVAGSVGAITTSMLWGGLTGGSAYLVSRLIQWLAAREQRASSDAFVRHLTLFQASSSGIQ
jgi:hypothetical protein